MTHTPSSALLELASCVAEQIEVDNTVLVVAADSQALCEALVSVGLGTSLGDEAEARFHVAVIVSDDANTPSPRYVRDQVLPRLYPGAIILWATVHARAARHLDSLLYLSDAPATGPSLEADAITTHLEGAGAEVERLADLPDKIQPALQTILDAVAAAGGDAESLRQQASASHHVLRARLPRRRVPRGDDSEAALRSAVQGAVAAGVSIGAPTNQAGHAPQAVTSSIAPRVTIVVPVFNGAALTEKCLYGIAGNTGEGPQTPEYEVVVVDNGSEDWTMYLLHAMEGDIRVMSNDRNLGFARACNQGTAESQADYLLFLNNDTVPHQDWLAPMVAVADADPQVGIVGARLLYPDGTVQHAGLHLVNGIPDHQFRGVAGDDPQVLQYRDLDMVTGACLLIRRDLFEALGGFDAQFLNGVEDVDLCLRARDRGFRVVYCPDAVVDHHEAQSEGRFDHVQANVERFLSRWQGRFDATGRLVGDVAPTTGADVAVDSAVVTPTAGAEPSADTCRVNIEGSFFVHSSLAHVNRELALALIASGTCELGLVGFEPDQFDVGEDPRYAALAQRMNRPLADADVHVRHRWPPDLSAVPSGRYALMQPWEFGSVPRAWVEAVRTGVVHQVWAYTRYVRDCYIDSGVDAQRVAIVPPGIDADRFRPGLTPHEVVRTDGSFRFLFVGGTLYRKGIDILLRAWREAFSATDDVALVIKDMGVGTFYRDQTAGQPIRELQSDPGCAEIQYLTQDVPGSEVPRLYAAADALVHPYRGEGFGLPVAEAMACGLPVIVTRGGACDDFCPSNIGYGVASRRRPVQLGGGEDVVGQAWQLEPDLDALVTLMRAVFEGRKEAGRRGAAGSEYVRSRFTWQHSAEAALAAVAVVQSGELDTAGTTVQGSEPVGTDVEVSPDVAVVLLGDTTSGEEATPALTRALGRFHRFAVDMSSGHSMGEQLEAIRLGCEQERVELIFVLAPDVWDLTSPASAQELRRLRQHFATENLGMLTPGASGTDGSLIDINYPEASCILCRLEAITAIGGFDASFRSLAVFANGARSLRRKGWRVAAAGDVLVEDSYESSPQVVAFGDGSLADIELAAVEAMENGDRRRDTGDVHAAIDFYQKTLELKHDFVETILVLADAQVEAHDGTGALATVRRLIGLDPESSFSHNYAGLVAARAGEVEAARESFARAVELDPDLVDARVNLGVVEWEQRNLEAALVQFREASARDPFNRDLVCNLGLVYGQIDDLEAAAALYRGYLEQHPEDTDVVARLAKVLFGAGELVAAQEAVRTVLQREPEHAEARALLTEISQGLGEDEAAQG
jgi:GT2 family glycosyltransferase/glycosyltransferase involved in cell wall biosynthesis/Tfp pilus assembly protein PilF